ncbi:YggS family pyridoxal phosphate-dependent enzyme [Candidatus Methylospira mobilis]|uniref:YggS family pyridoxal phosphate-dependent enzyme n=1 Tax=Candidatus Methylospira mobilis TaxID=1808979 RepID=UPI0028EC9DF5|nr:YggS family pyridoxal phosphate-dependent enzyme [Candidatus Methylospira mobilis]WNV04846.1 YggS family pyridoxal phosphate-dependent enzyme [Candidatus Methylospira mobilis]
MTSIAERLQLVKQRLLCAEASAGRTPGSVTLVAVSKTQPTSCIREAWDAGQRHFGESYLQEALAKQAELAGLDLIWHFIGPIQSNKTRLIAGHFEWVHGVDRLKIAERLNEQRPENLPPLNVCLQVNISDEASKSGVSLAQLPALAEQVARLPGLKLRGLMAIPEPGGGMDRQRIPFRRLRLALEALHAPGMDTLSMGMSDDLEAAVMEGATLVRIGSAIFGARPVRM